ncbi:hypothetical protein RZS08_40920, partial [Arthrospira platensis SPKY1]|nr:hypothetical protein [Arthrospira platensis SPKY1]
PGFTLPNVLAGIGERTGQDDLPTNQGDPDGLRQEGQETAQAITPAAAAPAATPAETATRADTAEIEPIIEGLPENYAESVRDMYRLVTELGLTNNGQSFAWQPAVRQLKETL